MSNGNYQETHERILKSGLAAFLEEGFEKANLRRICKAAGVTTGAFYKHFKDKEALFPELVCSGPTAPPTSTSLTGSSTRRTGPPSAFSS